MKQRAFIIVLFVMLIVAFFAWNKKRRDREGATPLSDVAERDSNVTVSVTSNSNVGSGLIPHQLARQFASNLATTATRSKENQYREGLQNLNHVPIEYYGRVVDEAGNPLRETKVKWTVFYKNGFREGSKSGDAISDEQGNFAIVGESGKSITLIPEKAGYVFVATNGTAIYSHLWSPAERHISNPRAPTQLTMWRLKGAEELIRIEQQYRPIYDGKPLLLDFLTGKRVQTGGDLNVIVQRSEGNISFQNPKLWSLTLQPVEGGILEIPNQYYSFAVEAPETGYHDSWNFRMDAKDKWFPQANGSFIVRTRDGRVYGKISIIFYINESTNGLQYLSISGVANPNGSRNLEEEPSKIKTAR